MSLVDHLGEVEYPFSQKTVFKAILEAAPQISGLTLDSADEMSGRVQFKAGVSLASWGENIPITLVQIAPNRTQMKVMSTPKTGVMFGGAADFGKNRQNINKIINAVSKVLKSYPAEEQVESTSSVDIVEKLTQLKALADQGVLTEEEFKEQKEILLHNSPTTPSTTSTTPTHISASQESKQEGPIVIEGSGEESSTNYALIALVVFIVIMLLCLLPALSSCQSPKNKAIASDNDSIAVVQEDTIVADSTAGLNLSSSSNSSEQTYTDNHREKLGFGGSYEQGMYDGLNDGAEDAVNGRRSSYKYAQSGSDYRRGYREGYDEAYAEGVNVMNEAEREYQKLSSEYGLDDY